MSRYALLILLLLINCAQAEENKIKSDESQVSAKQIEQTNVEQSSAATEFNIDGINKTDIVWGNQNSKVLLVVYSSFTCPACAYYHEHIYSKLKEKYIDNNKIAYILRLFIANKQDIDSATLALCNKEKFTPFVEILYKRQQSWAFNANYRDILTNIGQFGGVSAQEYQKCLNDESLRDQLILQSKGLNEKFTSGKIVATPAFILNGKLLNSGHSVEILAKEIDKLLQENEQN
jgi:protein-disulfide isomerase